MKICKGKKNIALIGARGSGKSEISKQLSKLSLCPVMSTDMLSSYENDGLSITEIIEQEGWENFRKLEYKILLKLAKIRNIIIDCGGGILVDIKKNKPEQKSTPSNKKYLKAYSEIYSEAKAKLLKRHCHLIYLRCPENYLIKFNEDFSTQLKTYNRPPFFKTDYSKLLKERFIHYEKVADTIIDMKQENSLEELTNFIYQQYFR